MRRLREMAIDYQDFTETLAWQQSFELLAPKFRDKSTNNILVKFACLTLSFRRARDIIEELNTLIHSLSKGGSRDPKGLSKGVSVGVLCDLRDPRRRSLILPVSRSISEGGSLFLRPVRTNRLNNYK